MEVGILQKKDNGRYWLFMQPSVMGLGSKFKLISIWFNGPQRVIRRVLQRSIYSKHSILTRLFFYQVHKRFCVCTNVLSWILQSLNVKVLFRLQFLITDCLFTLELVSLQTVQMLYVATVPLSALRYNAGQSDKQRVHEPLLAW